MIYVMRWNKTLSHAGPGIRRSGQGHRIMSGDQEIDVCDGVQRIAPGKAYCSICDKIIGTDRRTMLSHSKSKTHQKRRGGK